MVKGPIKQNKKKRKKARKYHGLVNPEDEWHGSTVYRNLPLAIDNNGFCGSCRTDNNPKKEIATTTGKKTVFVCRNCSQRMRIS